MFTGIISDIGIIEEIRYSESNDVLLKISLPKDKITRKPTALKIGCSIACNGICLTLISKKTIADKIFFSFAASQETIDKTNISQWKLHDAINIEFALRAADELGGHLVLGHVDCVTKVLEITKIKDSHRILFAIPAGFKKFLSTKGSVCLNGVSLTINEVQDKFFAINLIEHSWNNTSFNKVRVGDTINLEVDMIARYLDRLLKK